jgi:Terpene cyclase DEP1
VESRRLQFVYFALAAIGLSGCWYFNIQWSRSTLPQGANGFIRLMFANSASSSISWDLLFGSIPVFIFMIVEGRRVGMRRPWLYAVAGLVTAFAFVCPLFLGMRERHLARGVATGERRGN